MNSEWKEVKLGEVCNINKNSYSLKDNWEFINYLDTGNITENRIDNVQYLNTSKDKIPSRAKRKINQHDIIYSTVRPNQKHYGIIKTPVENMLVSTGFAVITSKIGKADNRYLYYYLTQQHIVDMLHTIGEHSTSAYPSIKPSDIEGINMRIPALSEQKVIADTLSCLDDKIELNNRMNKTLEEMAQTIFKSWFVDFEPFQDGEFEDSELGRVPKGWRIGTLGEYCEIQKGLSYKGKHLVNDGVPMINLGNVEPGGEFRYGKMKYYDGEYKERHIVKSGDIIIANTDMTADRVILGSPIFVPKLTNGDIIFTHHLFAFSKIKISKVFLYYYLKSNTFRERAESYANGTTVLALSKEDVLSIKLVVPDEENINKYHELIGNVIKLKEKNMEEIHNLQTIRNSLLPKLMSGEVRVPIKEVK